MQLIPIESKPNQRYKIQIFTNGIPNTFLKGKELGTKYVASDKILRAFSVFPPYAYFLENLQDPNEPLTTKRGNAKHSMT